MILKRFFLLFILICLNFAGLPAQTEDSDQQIGDFSLSGYGEKGKKSWDLSGKTADIFDNIVKLKDLTGNLYGAKEDVKLTAEKGDFDRVNGKIHVERNVVITTSSGARLTTDSLDWDRVNSIITTKDIVVIKKENLYSRARGARGQPSLNQMNLEKDVTVTIEPQASPAKKGQSAQEQIKVVITCDGPLEIDYAKNVAIFNNNVKADRKDTKIYSNMMEIYFSSKKEKGESPASAESSDSMLMGTSIDKVIARGNVKTVRGENITYSDEATYNGADNRLVFSGRPKLLLYSTEDFKELSVE